MKNGPEIVLILGIVGIIGYLIYRSVSSAATSAANSLNPSVIEQNISDWLSNVYQNAITGDTVLGGVDSITGGYAEPM